MKTLPVAEAITAWRCIGCGRIEAPQNCIGVCEDRKFELVSAWDYADALEQLEDAIAQLAELEGLVVKLAHTTPREGAWKTSYLALQAEAADILSRREPDR